MERNIDQSIRRRALGALTGIAAALALALAISGCGDSVNATLVKEAGVHGEALEKVYVLYNKDVLKKVSSRDLKDINAALKAGDLKQATPGDVRRAQSEIQSRIRTLERFVSQIKTANRKLKNTPEPNFSGGLEKNFAHDEFAKAYSDTTSAVERYTTSDLGVVNLAFSSLEKYLDFLEQWEEFLTDSDTDDLVSSGKASDKALARLKKASDRVDRRGSLSGKISPLVDRMASAATNSSQLKELVSQLKKDYPKSFLAVHVVEKKSD